MVVSNKQQVTLSGLILAAAQSVALFSFTILLLLGYLYSLIKRVIFPSTTVTIFCELDTMIKRGKDDPA